MKFTEITDPLDGERLVYVHPRPAPLVDADQARQRFVTGRSVSAVALDEEMDNRNGRTRLFGRALRPGVVFGLEVGADTDHDGNQTVITVAPGMGLCASGEDVVVPRAMVTTTGAEHESGEAITALDLPFHRTASIPVAAENDRPTLRDALAEWQDLFPAPEFTEPVEILRPGRIELGGLATTPAEMIRSVDRLDFASSVGLTPRLPTSISLRLLGGAFSGVLPVRPHPFLAVLVVEPIYTEELGAGGDPSDPCERDPEAEPFEDWRYVDGARLAWYAMTAVIDDENVAVPDEDQVHWLTWFEGVFGSTALSPAQTRNRAAWALFDMDARRNPAPLPWERDAVPIALVAFASDGEIEWIDRASVVRQAGRYIQGESPVPSAGDPALWQARIEQFNDQLSEMTVDTNEQLASHMRWLPPAGILPRELYDFDERATLTFPNGWGISAAPIPLDQLDEVLRSVAQLSPFDLTAGGDEVKLLVPIDPSNWDPRLLQIAAVHPAFHAALREAEQRIELFFASRGELRSKIGTLYGALGGDDAVPEFPPDEDPEYQHEWVTRTLVWDSVDAVTMLWATGQGSSGSPFQTPDAIRFAAIMLLWSSAEPGNATTIVGTEVGLLTDALVDVGTDGEVAVVPMAPDAPLELETGVGFALNAGWTHPSMVNREDGLAVVDDPAMYLVLGTLDTESLDRAMAFADGRPLIVVAGGISQTAVEELHWHHHRHPERMPLVATLRGNKDTRATRLLDVALRVGATEVPDSASFPSPELGRLDQIGFVLSSQTQTVVVDASGEDQGLVAARLAEVDALIEALEDGPSPQRRELRLRRKVLTGRAAVIKVPDLLDPNTGGSRVLRTRLAAEIIRRVQGVKNIGDHDGTSLLRLAAPARQPDYGTSATPFGLGSAILGDLKQRMQNALTPPDGVRVLTDAEVDLLQDIGIIGLMGVLKEKVNRADDVVDFGFLQIQALTFRIREYLLGRDAALAASSSPILADLADLIQRNTDPDALQAFFDALKEAADKQDEPGDGGGNLGGRWFTEALNLQVTTDKLYANLGGFTVQDPFDDLLTLNWDPGLIVPIGGGDPPPWWTAGNIGELVMVAGGLERVTTPTEALETAADVTVGAEALPEETRGVARRVAESGSAPAAAAGTPSATQPSGGGFTTDGTIAAGNFVDGLAAKPEALAFFAEMVPARFGTPFAGTWGMPQAGAFVALDQTFDVLSSPAYLYESAVQTQTVTKVASVGIAKMVQAATLVKAMHPVDWTLRSTGIKKRIQDPKAVSLRAEAFRLRGTITQTIHNLTLNIEGLQFPGFIDATSTESLPRQIRGVLDKTTTGMGNVSDVLQGKHDLVTADADVGDLISEAVQSLETTAALLRIVEVRIGEVRALIRVCRRGQSAVERQIRAAEGRHDLLDQGLAEAKHDLTVTRSLLAEERERVAETNDRRQRVLDDEVPFVVFHRARQVDLHDDLPVHDVEPSISLMHLFRDVFDGPPPPAPDELRDAVELFRDAPARWIREFGGLLERIDQVRSARRALEHARMRAAFRLAEPRLAPPATLIGLRGLPLVAGLVTTRRSHMVTRRQAAASLNLQHIARFTWKQAQVTAAEVMTFDDIITATDIPANIPKRVSTELDRIYALAAHLYRELTLVEPYIRADWARRMSEFDRPLDLRDLSTLPYWEKIGEGSGTSQPDPFRKRELQALVNWLFTKLPPEPDDDAFGLMNDLVRICVLLSAHAPVGQILSGHVDEPTPVEPGRLVPVRLDVSRLRIGMHAVITLQGVVQARGIVEDLGDGIATARLVSAAKPGLVLQPGDPVRFIEADGASEPTTQPMLFQAASTALQLLT